MTPQQIQENTQAYGSPPIAGSYSYDRRKRLYGAMGGHAMGVIKPGYDFGQMPENASSGNIRIYINGRHIPAVILQAYASLPGQIKPGSYWLDAFGR